MLFPCRALDFGEVTPWNEALAPGIQQLLGRAVDSRVLSAYTNQREIWGTWDCTDVQWDWVETGLGFEVGEVSVNKEPIDVYFWVLHVREAELRGGAELTEESA
jgi:hypothetical protein